MGDRGRAEGGGARLARSLATVEVVDRLEPRPGAVVLPSWCSTPSRSRPAAPTPRTRGYYDRDNDFYVRWDEISRDRDVFASWMERHVRATAGIDEYHRSLRGA